MSAAKYWWKPRYLIVDDDPGQRLAGVVPQRQVRGNYGSQVNSLEVLGAAEIQMMISDVRMPGMSGLETLKRVRERHSVLPVLLVTAFPDVRDAVGAMRDGAVNYLQKPIDLDELLASVRKAIGLEQAPALRFSDDKRLPEYVVAKSPLT